MYVDLQKIFPPFPRRLYGVAYVDPPWKFQPFSNKTGMDRSADNHYPTLDTDMIIGIGPFVPVARDLVLFLWATSPMLPQAMQVMKAWGFDYKSSVIWVKDKIGTGYWFRNAHELLLVGTRGNFPAPAPGTQDISAIKAPAGEHSTKPDVFVEMIERQFPTLPKIELFRRGQAREGWAAWGNQASD